MAYALLAGLRTVSDTDTGWHLAGGRYIWQTKTIPSVDVMSYTADGKPWIYPILSQLLLFSLYQLGGFASLSYLNAAACASTVALLLRRSRVFTAVLAIIAIPSIAHRTAPRGDLFTMVLFAWCLRLLVRHYEGERVRLWLLPVLMLAWVNLHLGFGAGLALLAAYTGFEALELLFAARRGLALARLKIALPWIGLSVAAVFVNPWGAGILRALLRQSDLIKHYGDFFNEWNSVRIGAGWNESLDWRNPESGYWWLLAVALAAAVTFLLRAKIGPAALLGGVGVCSLVYVRFQPLLAIATVALAESALFPQSDKLKPADDEAADRKSVARPHMTRLTLGAAILLLAFVGVRIGDIVTNRYYLSSGQTSLFGSGLSWWFPQAAADFVEREKLPANIFHDYNTGGFLNWRLGPAYKTYIDGRAIPFGPDLFFRQRVLLSQTPDSADWLEEIAQRNIQTILLPVARYAGLGSFPLAAYCQSMAWQVVHLDTSAIVLVRTTALDAERLARLKVDCSTVKLFPEKAIQTMTKAERYNTYMNAAAIEFLLSRDMDAMTDLNRAEETFSQDSNLYLLRGQLHQARNEFPAAEHAFRTSIGIRPTDAALLSLSLLYSSQLHYDEAVPLLGESIRLSQVPHERLLTLGQVKIALKRPDEALAHFEEAAARSPYRGAAESAGTEFNAGLAEGRARAWRLKGDLARAIEFAEISARLTANSDRRWALLAELFVSSGQAAKAEEIRRKIDLLRQPATPPPKKQTH